MRRILLLTMALSALGCGDSQPKAKIGETMPAIILPPQSTMLSKDVGEEALKMRFRSELEPGAVADYYRSVLSAAPWRLVSDARDATGAIALYAERPDGPPLWVMISKASGATGSFVDLAGAKTK
jgi:hypothetical protein